MRVLHTADWHLGQRFALQYRQEEHDRFLNWLYNTLCDQQIETLVIAGDIFDSAHPPAFAQQQYYRFLARLVQSPCRHIIITGGNHDSPAFLEAAGDVLKALNVHVIGAAREQPDEHLLYLPDKDAPRLVVAAIPFLRDGDLRQSNLGDSSESIEEQIRQGIFNHYLHVGNGCTQWRAQNVPVMATGHLFAQGGTLSDTERTIHVGNLAQVSAAAFGEVFDYVALGHLHRPQTVGGKAHIRYSGSPIPLSFAEWQYPHEVVILEFTGAGCPAITTLQVPVSRRLIRRQGTTEQLLEFLMAFEKEVHELPAWLDLKVTDCTLMDEARRNLYQAAKPRSGHLEIVYAGPAGFSMPQQTEVPEGALSLEIMQHPEQVFQKLLDRNGIKEETESYHHLQTTFGELLDLYYTSGTIEK